MVKYKLIRAPSSDFVSSSIPSWQILTVHAQPFRGARDLAFCLKVPLDSLLVWASSGGSGETARMRRLAWTFGARIVPNSLDAAHKIADSNLIITPFCPAPAYHIPSPEVWHLNTLPKTKIPIERQFLKKLWLRSWCAKFIRKVESK